MKKLRTRIFFPILIVLFTFPLFTFVSFTLVSDSYFENMAGRNTTQMVRMVRRVMEEYPGKLIRGLRSITNESPSKTSVLVYSRDLELRFPKELPQTPGISGLVEQCRNMAAEKSYKEKELLRLDLEEGSYMVQFLTSSKNSGLSGYIICYSSIPNIGALMESVWKLLLLITGFCLILSAIIIWFIAGGISLPIKELCAKAEAIGKGDYAPVPDSFRIEELEELRRSIDRMAKELKISEESTVSFFQNASHDLKTPLSSISGYAQAIECGIAEDDKKAAAIILGESKRMTALVESILTISKLDNRGLKLDMVMIGLDEFLEDQAQILQGSTEKRIILEENMPEVLIEADQKLLTRILHNLVSNGLRYAEHELRIGLKKEKDIAIITVEDDGPGILTSDIPHIFDRFYKGGNGGFGLGLSIVREGMDYLGGTVRAENKNPPEHGAVFTLSFPIKKNE